MYKINIMYNFWCFVAFYAVLLQNPSCLCDLRCFVAKSVLSLFTRFCVEKNWAKIFVCGEKRTNIRYGPPPPFGSFLKIHWVWSKRSSLIIALKTTLLVEVGAQRNTPVFFQLFPKFTLSQPPGSFVLHLPIFYLLGFWWDDHSRPQMWWWQLKL